MIGFYFLQFTYLFCQRFFSSFHIQYYLLDLIKAHVFEIKGGCKHSGQCCQSIMLYDNKKPLDSLVDWQYFLKQNPNYYSFEPNHIAGKISSFDCSCLTQNNRCSRYSSRPSICQKYPTSFFYEHGFIYDSCGYYVEKNKQKFASLLLPIQAQLNSFFRVKA